MLKREGKSAWKEKILEYFKEAVKSIRSGHNKVCLFGLNC